MQTLKPNQMVQKNRNLRMKKETIVKKGKDMISLHA